MLAWFKGGQSERFAAAVLLIVFALSSLFPHVRNWNVDVADAVLDLTLTAVLARQAMTGNRWWPLAATAVMALTLMVHAAMFAVPTMSAYTDHSARIGLGIMLALTLMAGVGERWLAGERPAGASRRDVRVN